MAELPPIVILRLRNMTAIDATGLHALEKLSARLRMSGKTLVTTNDTGGVLEFATAESGFIAEPNPASLGAEMTRAWATPKQRLREMAEVGRTKVAPIQWDAVIDTLTETIR